MKGKTCILFIKNNIDMKKKNHVARAKYYFDKPMYNNIKNVGT